jgi:hypothetical protein
MHSQISRNGRFLSISRDQNYFIIFYAVAYFVHVKMQQTSHYTRNSCKPAPQNTTGKRRKQTMVIRPKHVAVIIE